MDVTRSSADHDKTARDLNRVETSNWPAHLFPLTEPRVIGTRVVVRQSVLNEIHRHGKSQTDVEVCGVLVGNGYRDASGAFVYIEACIRGEFAGSQLAQVTFTSETWCHIQEVMDRRHSERRIVGWYHTHPGFGIFLSPMDLFIHENFFGDPEQLALVYDPLSGDEGIFVWRSGQPVRESVLVEADEAKDGGIESPAARHLPPLTAAASVNTTFGLRIEQIERRQRWLTIGFWNVALLTFAWPIVFWRLQSHLLNERRFTSQPVSRKSSAEQPIQVPFRESQLPFESSASNGESPQFQGDIENLPNGDPNNAVSGKTPVIPAPDTNDASDVDDSQSLEKRDP